MSKSAIPKWLARPEDHDYPAAHSYLNLLYDGKTCDRMVAALKRAPVIQFKAKDIFRAARLPLLNAINSHVQKNIEKISAGKNLSPVLLVRNPTIGQVVIADGYHRICAVYTFDEDASIPCKII